MFKVTDLSVTLLVVDWYTLVRHLKANIGEIYTNLLCLCPFLTHDPLPFRAPWSDRYCQLWQTAWDPTTLKGFRIRHSAGNQAIGGEVDRDRIAILVFRVFNIKSP